MFFVACYTAEHFASLGGQPHIRDYAVGTVNSLNPREVAPRLLRALEQSNSMREFIESLSDESLNIWVSNNFLRSINEGAARTVRAPIYKQMKDGTKSIVGFIFMFIPCKLFGGCK